MWALHPFLAVEAVGNAVDCGCCNNNIVSLCNNKVDVGADPAAEVRRRPNNVMVRLQHTQRDNNVRRHHGSRVRGGETERWEAD